MSIAAREQRLISEAKERGYVTFEEVQALYPAGDEYLDAVDALLVRLIEEGVAPVPAASVQPAVEAIAAAQRREAVGITRTKIYAPLDPVGLYLAEIKQFPVLTRNQERWLGIAMECPKLTLDNPKLLGPDGGVIAQSLEMFFRQVLRLAAREGAYVLEILPHTHRERPFSENSGEGGRLIQEVQEHRQGNRRRKRSVLARLLKRCPERYHDHLFNLCVYLWALPTSALQFLRTHSLRKGCFPSEQMTARYHLDERSQLSQKVGEIRQRAEQARLVLILRSLRLVTSVAWRYKDKGLPILDLYQEGNLGLLKAVEGFDYRQGNRFSTYAVWWIRQSIVRAIADQSRLIRLPVHIQETLNMIRRTQDTLEEELGREPDIGELAEQCEMSPQKLRRTLKKEPGICSLDSLLCCPEFPLRWDDVEAVFVQARPCPVRQYAQRFCLYSLDSQDDDFECPPCVFGQRTPDELAAEENVDYSMLTLDAFSSHEPSLDTVLIRQLPEDLDRFLGGLTERQRQVIEKRFGLADGWEYTLEEVGRELGVTRERIRQIEAKALKWLRHPERRARLRHYSTSEDRG
jgi:RNA polymerase sigma factor (sigma-70 family)